MHSQVLHARNGLKDPQKLLNSESEISENKATQTNLATLKNTLIFGKYKLNQKLGSGSFGVIYSGINIIDNEKVAIKLEVGDTKHPQLHYESRVYKLIKGGGFLNNFYIQVLNFFFFRLKVGIPTVYCYGTECNYNIMVMDLLGQSLEDIFNLCQRKFSLKTILLLAQQMV